MVEIAKKPMNDLVDLVVSYVEDGAYSSAKEVLCELIERKKEVALELTIGNIEAVLVELAGNCSETISSSDIKRALKNQKIID